MSFFCFVLNSVCSVGYVCSLCMIPFLLHYRKKKTFLVTEEVVEVLNVITVLNVIKS